MKKIQFSALSLVPKFPDEKPIDAINRAINLGPILEKLGYSRYWISEHHNYQNVLSTSTSTLVQGILQQTDQLRVGAGGVMATNHCPLVIAETYGMLATMYPHRVDLGLGRSPGTDAATIQKLGQNYQGDFRSYIEEIQTYFGPVDNQGDVVAYPAPETEVPVYILGSSLNSPKIAGELGLPYAFAGHVSERTASEAIKVYRESFRPSEKLSKPYVILTCLVYGGETDISAQMHYRDASNKQTDLAQNVPDLFELSSFEFLDKITTAQKMVIGSTGISLVGDKENMAEQLEKLVDIYQPDEIMGINYSPRLEDLEESYQMLAQVLIDNFS